MSSFRVVLFHIILLFFLRGASQNVEFYGQVKDIRGNPIEDVNILAVPKNPDLAKRFSISVSNRNPNNPPQS